MCQVEGCKADLRAAHTYYRRHELCPFHSKASKVVVAGRVQRFCQQCSRYFSVASYLLQVDQAGFRVCAEIGVFHLFFCVLCQK